ncbi:MAG: hypothetical protein EOP51_31635, partial [Sphingobacteriales bacterium]
MARFRYIAGREGIDFNPRRGLDKNQVDRLFTGAFIKKGQDILLHRGRYLFKVIFGQLAHPFAVGAVGQ